MTGMTESLHHLSSRADCIWVPRRVGDRWGPQTIRESCESIAYAFGITEDEVVQTTTSPRWLDVPGVVSGIVVPVSQRDVAMAKVGRSTELAMRAFGHKESSGSLVFGPFEVDGREFVYVAGCAIIPLEDLH